MHLKVVSFSLVVSSPLPLPTWSSLNDHPYPGQFTNIFSIRHIYGDQYEVACSQLSVFTVAADIATLAEQYEISMSEAHEVIPI